ncbi:MAG: hypothetical protein KJZ80_07310 [Hyphomicrobiaceae bacterium]|nr:hypothetical protein [Hyphomicrobiaceae bacterium]
MAEQRFASKTFALFGGLLIWGAHFMIVYSANALACTRGLAGVTILGAGLVPLFVLAATAAALGAAGYLLVTTLSWRGALRGERSQNGSAAFLRIATLTITLLSAIAIAWTALPAAIVQPCA